MTEKLKRVLNELRNEIAGMEIDEEDPPELSSEDRLAAEYGVSRTSIRRVIEVLEGEGLVRKSHGRKTRIVKPKDVRMPRLGPDEEGDGFASHWEEPGDHDCIVYHQSLEKAVDMYDEARRINPQRVRTLLGLDEAEGIVITRRVRSSSQRRFVLQLACCPQKLLGDEIITTDHLLKSSGAEEGVTGLYERCGIERCGYRSWYFAASASPAEAGFLEIAVHAPVLVEERVSYYRPGKRRKPAPYEYLFTVHAQHAFITVHTGEVGELDEASVGSIRQSSG